MKKEKQIRDFFKIIKEHWKKLGLIIAFDILFIILLINLRFVSTNTSSWLAGLFSGFSTPIRTTAFISFVIIASIALIAVYSFFKFIVLGYIQKIFMKKELDFKRFLDFFKLNLLFGSATILMYILSFALIISFMTSQTAKGLSNIPSFLLNLGALLVLILAIAIYLYTVMNLAHNIFLNQTGFKKIVKQAFIMSRKVRSYKVYWGDIKLIPLALILLLIYYIIMKIFVFSNLSLYLKYSGIYGTGTVVIILFALYCMLMFNRIYFYKIVHKES